MSIYYDLIVEEKSLELEMRKWYVMDHQSVTNLQNLVHGFWEDSKALVYRGSRKSPDRLGQGQYETNCEL